MLGEWLALPLVGLAGSKKIGDEPFSDISSDHSQAFGKVPCCAARRRTLGRRGRNGPHRAEPWFKDLRQSRGNSRHVNYSGNSGLLGFAYSLA